MSMGTVQSVDNNYKLIVTDAGNIALINSENVEKWSTADSNIQFVLAPE